jgi:hypothetical protein
VSPLRAATFVVVELLSTLGERFEKKYGVAGYFVREVFF